MLSQARGTVLLGMAVLLASLGVSGHAWALPDMVVTAVSNPPATAGAGGQFSVTDTTSNQGTTSAPEDSATRHYLSFDTAKNAGDILLNGKRDIGKLAVGASSTGTRTVTIPGTITNGFYYLLACADDQLQLAETIETNNCLASSTTVQVTGGTDPPPSLSINNVTVTEGNSGTTSAVFTVTKSAASGVVTVAYATADGTAVAPGDYATTSGTLTIAAGATTGTITVLVVGDRLIEADETFTVTLSSPTNATIATGVGTGTIRNDDFPPPPPDAAALAARYHLRAASGVVTMPDGEVVTIWGFGACADAACASLPTVSLPGPQLEMPPGETLTISIKNDLSEPVSLIVAGQAIVPVSGLQDVPGQSYTAEVAPGWTGTYRFTNLSTGTYLYESGTNQSKQVQMGLYGALIVRPTGYTAGNKIDYAPYTNPAGVTVTTGFDREEILVLSEIDPAWHAAVVAGQPYNAVYFQPKYWLINGKAYPETRDILAAAGSRVLLRYLNAGSQDHVMVVQGLSQTTVADDGNQVTYPQDTSAVVMNPGQTQDLMLVPSAAGAYPLYDRRLDITNRDQFPGGMITMVRVIDGTTTGLSILSSAPTLVTAGQTYVYDLVAVNPANLSAPLTYTLSGPVGMTINQATGRISWPTTLANASAPSGTPQNASVTVSNGATTATQAFTIYVNSPPVIAPIANQTLNAGSPLTLSVAASDPDTTPIPTELVSLSLISSPPLGMTINSATGQITWTPTESQVGTYAIQVQGTDGRGGVASQVFNVTVNTLLPPPLPPAPVIAPAMYPVTITAIEYGTTTLITDFKFIVNVDNTPLVTPGAVPPCNPCPGTHQYESNSPVAATGTVTSATPGNATINLPAGRYLVTVLAGTGTTNLEMRNGGVYRLDGKHFTVTGPGATAVSVELHKDPLPWSQVTVQVFNDSRLNAAWEPGLEGAPARNGVVDHFKIVLRDALGDVSTDGLGNPICSEYDTLGNVVPGTGGECLTDNTGFIAIKNLPPDKYGVVAIPPTGSDWIQTTTIEGTKSIDAWSPEGNSGILPEGIGPLSYLAFQGFVRPCAFGDTTDACPTNDVVPAATGTIQGTVKKLQPARPPFLQPDGLGEPVKYPWVALKNLSGNLEYVALVRGDATGHFVINNVPAASQYTVVIWDDPQDYIITFMPTATPATAGFNLTLTDPRFNGLAIPIWWSRMVGTVYLDSDEDGLKGPSEPGLPGEYVEVRYRDGSLMYSTVTDSLGNYDIKEFFPWFHWQIAGIGYTRLGNTGVHVVAGEGLTLLGQPVVEERVDHGPVLTMGTLGWAGDTNRLDWGKKPYPLLGNLAAGNDYAAPNGGISGAVWYATTRNENDIRFAAIADWEPGIPDLWLNLYERLVDPATGHTVMDPVTGGAKKGRHLGRVVTDHYNRPGAMPENCTYLNTTGAPTNDPTCIELIKTWNQIKTGVWDGAYQFFYDQSDPNNPNQLLDCAVVGVGTLPGQCRPLPAGTYLVELEVPPTYLPLTENDRNVIDQGDTFVRTLRAVPLCVGPLYLVTDPASPDVGKMVPRCDVKEVTVDQGANAAADFRIFTEVPIPARIRGFVNDNINIQGNKGANWFGDKAGVPFIPVSIVDFKGKEIVRVYTDAEGMFEAILPSTYRVNVPNPTGVSPGIVLVHANDRGPASNPDPHFNINYNTLVMEFDLWPGKMVLADMALTPVNGFLANKTIDCSPDPLTTPQITGVSVPYGSSTGFSFTISGTGFGLSQGTGTVTLDGVNLVVTSWSDTSLGVTVPNGFTRGPKQLLVTAGNGKVSPTGMTIHVTGTGYNPTFVPVTTTIQAAIDAASPGDVILVTPNADGTPKTYRENPIVWKSVTLQGYGYARTLIDGGFLDPISSAVWTAKMNSLIAAGNIAVLPLQATAMIQATVTVVANVGAGGVRIDGLMIQGGRVGGGVHVNAFANNTQISNNHIENNFGTFSGGVALGFPDLGDNQITAPRIHHNHINTNGSLGKSGGIGVFTGVSSYQIDHNLICGNGTTASGGGVSHYGTNTGSAGLIDHNDILFNWAFINGGGILVQGPPPVNLADPSPGSGLVTIDSNRIQGNFANLEGGGIEVLQAGTYAVRVVNNLIVNNVSATQGGGLAVQDASDLALINNTIAKNTSTSTNLVLETGPHAAGLVVYPHTTPFQNSLPAGSPTISDVLLFNNIFSDNIAYTWNATTQTLVASGPYDVGVYLSTARLTRVSRNLFTTLPAAITATTGNLIVQNARFAGAYDTVLTGSLVPAAGEVAINPIGVPVTISYGPLTAATGNYHLQGVSPAQEYGRATFSGFSAPTVDIDGQTRPIPITTNPDAGADERNQDTLPPTANGQSTATNEDTPVLITLSGSDLDSHLTFSVVTSPVNGTLSTIAGTACTSGVDLTTCTAQVTYTPNPNFFGSDSLTFRVNDGRFNSLTTATVSITVNPVNDAPVANDQTGPGNLFTLSGSDVDSTIQTFRVVTGPVNGTLSPTTVPACTAVGTGSTCTAQVTYTPNPNFEGPDSFTFVANDGLIDSNVATVNITFMKARWKLDEGTGTSFADAVSPGSNIGNLVNGPTWPAGLFGNAIALDGINDYGSVADSASFPRPGSVMTLATWMQPGGGACTNRPFVSKWGTGTAVSYSLGYRNNADCRVSFTVRIGGTSYTATSTTALNNTAAWYHVAGVYDGTTVRLYVNGVQNGTTAAATGTINASPTTNLVLGNYATLGATTYFQGILDEVQLWTRALSAAEIAVQAAPPPPVVTTGSATAVTATGAILNGTANPNGAAGTAWFEYGLDTSYGFTSATQVISGSSANPLAIGITGLAPSTLYYYRIGAQNSGGTTYGADATFTTLPTLSIDSVAMAEGNAGTTNMVFTVTQSAVSGVATTVNYATANGTAVAPGDYTTTNGTLTIAAGATFGTITVPVIGDTLYEPDETFTVTLSNPTNASIATGTGTGTIMNDDPVPAAPPTLSINNVTLLEGNAGTTSFMFTVTQSFPTALATTVNYATANGTAVAPGDYTATSGTLTIAAGATTGTITVPVVGDLLFEPNETFTVTLSNPTNASIATGTGTGTIMNDDTATVPGPDLAVTAFSNPPTVTRGVAFSVTDTTSNLGTSQSPEDTATRIYLSLDAAKNNGDLLLGGSRTVGKLAAGASSTGTRTVTIPTTAVAGTYFLLACADDRLKVTESNETNNCLASTGTVQVQ